MKASHAVVVGVVVGIVVIALGMHLRRIEIAAHGIVHAIIVELLLL